MDKENFLKIYNSKTFQIGMDLCRVLILVIAFLILFKLTTEIEAVKILNSDVCRVCENKTGAVCFIPDRIEDGVKIIEKIVPAYPSINFSGLI